MPKVETHVLSADDKEQPFALHVPNAETRAAMAEADDFISVEESTLMP
jgi:hypothetical protein